MTLPVELPVELPVAAECTVADWPYCLATGGCMTHMVVGTKLVVFRNSVRARA